MFSEQRKHNKQYNKNNATQNNTVYPYRNGRLFRVNGLLLGGTIVGYRKFNDRQLVIQSGKEFVSVLRLAQKRASVGDKPDIVGCNVEKIDGIV